MRSRTFILSDTQANELQAAFRQCRNADTKIRYQAVRLYGLGHPVCQILDTCDCSRRSLLVWVARYQREGIAALVDGRKGGNRAKLRPDQQERLQHLLHRYTPAQLLGTSGPPQQIKDTYWTLPALARLLEQEFGVTYHSPTSYYSLLAACELSYQRPALQYKSHSPAKLMAFEEELEKKAAGHRAVSS